MFYVKYINAHALFWGKMSNSLKPGLIQTDVETYSFRYRLIALTEQDGYIRVMYVQFYGKGQIINHLKHLLFGPA